MAEQIMHADTYILRLHVSEKVLYSQEQKKK